MKDDLVQKIASHPIYQELKAKRSSFGWWLTLAMMVVYYGFILLVAQNLALPNSHPRAHDHDRQARPRRPTTVTVGPTHYTEITPRHHPWLPAPHNHRIRL